MHTGPEWERARELFLDLADLSEDERRAALEEIAARDPRLASWVRDLLRHDEPAALDVRPERPRRFGPYEAVRPIGRGGMGEVFVARRADGEYESEVAVKLLRGSTADEELVRRFLRERQTLASLNHEYIARLLDGGTTEDGEPYLVMEYVEGEPADVFAGRLALRERLELFLRICRAVAHAHERGFVHRDLKPGNVLVRADGTPRLLDFGIARLDPEARAQPPGEDQLTRTGHRLFTPEYASPEQVLGEPATARSDIFSLGVILYVFLCGEGPWRSGGGLPALISEICEREPVPPSRKLTGTARARVSADLDAVVLQCLAKRPERRYASVTELADDLERHLEGRPILARRTGRLERAVRFARRRPAYPVGAVLLVLATGATWIAWQAERRGERGREELRSAVADRVGAARVRWSEGAMDEAVEELDAALVALRELPDEKELEAEVLAQSAVFASFRQRWAETLELIDRAQAALADVEDPDAQIVGKLLNSRAYALFRSESEGSREAGRIALDHALAHLDPGDVLRIDAVLGWADELRRSGEAEEALALIGEAIAEGREHEPKGEILSRLYNEQAVALARMGRLDEAAASYRDALEILSLHRGERNPSFAKVRLNLGVTLFRSGRLREAQEELERSLDSSRHFELDVLVASNQHFLGRIHSALGELEAAEVAAREAIAIRERLDLGEHTDRSRCLLGIVLARTERRAEARATLAPLLTDRELGVLLPDMEAEAQHLYGALLDDAGESATARPHLERALALKREQLGESHPDCLDLRRRLGEGG